MLFGEKQTKRSAVEKEVKKIIKGIMKSYEKEEITPLSGTKCVPVAQLNDQKLDTFIDLILQTMKGDVNDGSETNPTASSVLLS